MNPIYSIIIPHYNIPDLLMRCLASIPVDESIQVIVVDDCSPDAATYKMRYPQLSRPFLEFYSTEKGGSAGCARNVGMKYAKGKWLIFMDSDDFFENHILDKLNENLNYTSDINIFKSRCVKSNNITKEGRRDKNLFSILDISDPETRNWLLRYDFQPLWGKVFRHSFIRKYNIHFDETKWSNDCMFSLVAGYYANNINYIDIPFYILTERKDSLASSISTNSMSLEENIVRYEISIKCAKFLKQHGIHFVRRRHSNARRFMHLHPWSFIKYHAKSFFHEPMYILSFIMYLLKEKYKYIAKRPKYS